MYNLCWLKNSVFVVFCGILFLFGHVRGRRQRTLIEALDDHEVKYTIGHVRHKYNEGYFQLDFQSFEKKLTEYAAGNDDLSFRFTDLHPDNDLFHPQFRHWRYSSHRGLEALHRDLGHDEPDIQECMLSGKVRENSVQNKIIGHVKLNACGDLFSGQIHLKNKHQTILHISKIPLSGSLKHFDVSVHEQGRLLEPWTCGDDHVMESNSLINNSVVQHYQEQLEREFAETEDTSSLRANHRRDLDATFVASAQTKTKYLKLLVVNDNARFLAYGRNTHAVAAQLVQQQVALYEKLNAKSKELYGNSAYRVQVSIAGMVTFQYGDPWTIPLDSTGSIDSGTLLSTFNDWREAQGVDRRFPDHSTGQLLSGIEFVGDTVGLANLFSVCRNQISSSVVQAAGFQDETIATIMSHELAHNLGSYHTGTTFAGSLVSSPCGGFIMDANGIYNTEWSKCTVNYLKMFFEGYPAYCSGNTCNYPRKYGEFSSQACLEDPPTQVWSLSSICGNGLKENGEQCDCGSDDCSEIDPCCDGSTCTFASDTYECSELDPCCSSCMIVAKEKSSAPCRESKGVCDVAEYCDGQSSSCPFDEFQATGEECVDGSFEGSCYAGNCNSHGSQCSQYFSLGFDGPCVSRGNDDGDASCGILSCHPSGKAANVCEQVFDNSNAVFVVDGTTCLANGTGVCDSSSQTCVSPADLKLPASLTCYNGLLDTGETDIDCGGPLCSPCLPGDSCLLNSDCFNNDCVGSEYTKTDAASETNATYQSPSGGCTKIQNETACGVWSGCIWLEEFTRCKLHSDYPPSGECYTQKKRQSCINFEKCEWDYDLNQCQEVIGDPPQYGSCSGQFVASNGSTKWWEQWVDKIGYFFETQPFLAWTSFAVGLLAVIICCYACGTHCTRYCIKRRQGQPLSAASATRVTQKSTKSTLSKRAAKSSEKILTKPVMASLAPDEPSVVRPTLAVEIPVTEGIENAQPVVEIKSPKIANSPRKIKSESVVASPKVSTSSAAKSPTKIQTETSPTRVSLGSSY